MHLFHKWGPWSDPVHVMGKGLLQGSASEMLQQVKSCKICNEVRERHVSATAESIEALKKTKAQGGSCNMPIREQRVIPAPLPDTESKTPMPECRGSRNGGRSVDVKINTNPHSDLFKQRAVAATCKQFQKDVKDMDTLELINRRNQFCDEINRIMKPTNPANLD